MLVVPERTPEGLPEALAGADTKTTTRRFYATLRHEVRGPSVRQHAREAGANFVTAREGVEAVVDDLTWHPVSQLRGRVSDVQYSGKRWARSMTPAIGSGQG